MKTRISKIVTLIISLILFCSCSSQKKLQEQNTIVKSQIQKSDTLKTQIVNNAIDDKLVTPVILSSSSNPVLDSIVNSQVEQILQRLNTLKTSGDNSYSLLYDKLSKALVFKARVGQTKSENLQIKQERVKSSIQIKKVPVLIQKPLSRLERFLMGLGVLTLLFIGYKSFVFIRGKTSVLWG